MAQGRVEVTEEEDRRKVERLKQGPQEGNGFHMLHSTEQLQTRQLHSLLVSFQDSFYF